MMLIRSISYIIIFFQNRTEEAHSEVNKVRRIYEDKINGYVA